MTYLRFAVRHVQRTLEDLVEAHLTRLGWLGPEVPFGEPPVVFQRGRMDEAELRAVTGNLVAVSFGNEPDDVPLEMGGGLQLTEHYLFVDCIGREESVALALASDLKDCLAGRAPGTSRYVPVSSYLTSPATPVVGHRLELIDVIREKPDTVEYRRNWHVVKATVEQTRIGDPDV